MIAVSCNLLDCENERICIVRQVDEFGEIYSWIKVDTLNGEDKIRKSLRQEENIQNNKNFCKPGTIKRLWQDKGKP